MEFAGDDERYPFSQHRVYYIICCSVANASIYIPALAFECLTPPIWVIQAFGSFPAMIHEDKLVKADKKIA